MIEAIIWWLWLWFLSIFISRCFEDGMILSWYWEWLMKKEGEIYKPLWQCLYCMNFWIVCIIQLLAWLSLYGILLSIWFSFIAIEIYKLIRTHSF